MEQGQYKHVNALVVKCCLNWTVRTVAFFMYIRGAKNHERE